MKIPDRHAAQAKRALDIQRADDGAEEAWRDAVMAAIEEVAFTRLEFTTDDVLDAYPQLEEAREPRAWGPLMLRAAREGWIEPSDRYAPSSRKQSNARPKRLWLSLLHPASRPRAARELDIVQEVLW